MSQQVRIPMKPAAAPLRPQTPAPFGTLQRKCACGGSGGSPGECSECKKKTLQRHAANTAQPGMAPPIVHEVLRSPGRPLDAAARSYMEPRFGHNFGDVRIHTDARAAESALAIHAQAYTHGNDVVLAAGRYAPQTVPGRRLLAHELAHVVQQRNASSKATPQVGRLSIGQPGDRLEREADAAAERITGNTLSAAGSSAAAPGVLQRQSSESGNNLGQQGAQNAQPAATVDIQEDLSAVADDQGAVQLFPDLSLGPSQIQRQDFPPPPPAFPDGHHMILDMDNTELLWDLTCQDRRERGYFIFWDETTNKSSSGPVSTGDVWNNCRAAAELSLGTVPFDQGHIYTAGFFHTHPPPPPGCHKTKVGPSDTDLALATRIRLPGIVRDNSTPTARCVDERQGPFYFFGPSTREY